MRATAPFALSALFLAFTTPVALLTLSACDQDYAASSDGRETFMGSAKEVPASPDAAVPSSSPMAPPPMGGPPPPPPVQVDAATDAAASARPAALRPPAH